MTLLYKVAAALLAYGVATGAGLLLGRRYATRLRTLWTFVAILVLAIGAGYVAAERGVLPGGGMIAVGLMTGLLTGVRYGAFPPLGIPSRDSLAPQVAADKDAPGSAEPDAPSVP